MDLLWKTHPCELGSKGLTQRRTSEVEEVSWEDADERARKNKEGQTPLRILPDGARTPLRGLVPSASPSPKHIVGISVQTAFQNL